MVTTQHFVVGKYFNHNILTNLYEHAITIVSRMFKKIAVVSAFFLLFPLCLLLFLVLLTQYNKINYLNTVGPTVAAAESQENILEGEILGVQIEDMRPHYVANFLENTKLEPYSLYIVEVSDKYGIDYRLIPAIAMKESGGGNAIVESTHNAWGFENGKTVWPTWEEAIDNVGKTLKNRYVDRGMTTPDEMMPVYAPPQMHTGGKWAKDINRFFSQIESL